MAVFYRLSQVTSPKQKGYGKWYPRAVMTNTVDTDATMQDQLQDSKRVKLNGFGTFKIGMSSTGADKASDFDARKNIKGLHVLFMPEVKTDSEGQRQKTFISGCSVQEVPKGTGPSTGSGTVENGSGSSAGSETVNGGSGSSTGGSGIIPTPTDPEDDQPGD